MSIQITIQAETGGEARQKLSDLLGPHVTAPVYDENGASSGAGDSGDVRNDDRQDYAGPVDMVLTPPAPEQPQKRKRRTKAEIEQARAAEAKPQISAQPEARTAPDDPPEIQEQDEADEQAESDARKAANPALTRDDLRRTMGEYVTAYSYAVALEDGPKIFEAALGKPGSNQGAEANGVRVWTLSTVPEESFAPAIAAWKEAAEKNPFQRAKAT